MLKSRQILGPEQVAAMARLFWHKNRMQFPARLVAVPRARTVSNRCHVDPRRVDAQHDSPPEIVLDHGNQHPNA